MVDRLINLSECAQLMGVSLSKAYRLAKAQKAPFEGVEKYGSTYLVPYLAFCKRLGLEPGDVDAKDAQKDGDALCA